MATVWVAERVDGLLDRRVALKLPDMHAARHAQFAERMNRERDILASLTHPNIARLYDAGIDTHGRPYLALELVDGVPIDAYVARHRSSARAIVVLIRDAARAVGYAHGRLVVHRDLKPSNLLVDAQGSVRLVDFGIAKLLDAEPDAVDGSQLTLALGRALTPDYASPEQVRGGAMGTSSDLYSLGVVAYELLAGVRPYRLDATSDSVALANALARVRVARASDAARDPERARELKGDLDAILARMIATDPADRYSTMAAVADDLDRHLDGEPVLARTASRWYVASRWIRRHKLESGVALALLLAVVGGAFAQAAVMLAIGLGALVALWQRNAALKQAAAARAASERAEQVKSFVASIFTQAVPRAGRGGAVAATDLLKAAAHRVEHDLGTQPAVAAELAVLIGSSLNELGDLQAAMQWHPKAVDLATRALGPMHPLTLTARRRWVEAANTIGDQAVAEAILPALIGDLRQVRPPQPKLLVESLQSDAFVQSKHGREPQAIAALTEAIEVAVGHAGEASALALSARGSLSNTFVHFGRYPSALQAIEPAIAPAYASYGDQRPHPTLTMIERSYGDALSQNQRPRDATLILRQVLVDQRALDAEETTRVRVALSLLARALVHRGRFVEAHAHLAAAAAMHERLTGGRNLEGLSVWTWLALNHALLGDGGAAVDDLTRAASMTTIDEGDAYDGFWSAVRALAEVSAGRAVDALTTVDAAMPLVDRIAPTQRVRLRRVRAMALRRTDDVHGALDVIERTLDGIDPACVALEHGLLWFEAALCDRAMDRADLAATRARRALDVWEGGQVDGDEVLAPVVALLASLDAGESTG